MQNRYAGDVGDFGKIALLRALAGTDLTVGVNWYLNDNAEQNADGRFVNYSPLRHLDPVLFDALHEIVGSGRRSVNALQRSALLPANTIFFAEPLPDTSLSGNNRAAARDLWAATAVQALKEANLIFCDPDNGFAGSRVSTRSRVAAKYALRSEVETHLADGQSVIVYQHQTRRRGGIPAEIEHHLQHFPALYPDSFALIFRPYSARIYFVLPSRSHSSLLMQRGRSFAEGRWRVACELARPMNGMIAASA